MTSGLGHCEDPECCQSSSNHDLLRLFRCAIHCDRFLCLYHLNAHNVYYEEEKKQNVAVLNELQNCLTVYQSIFEQHMITYRELVHQASTILLQNTASLIPIEQIRPVLEKLQKAIAVFQHETVIIKSESILDVTEFDIEKFDSNLLKDFPSIKQEFNTPNKNHPVVLLERVDVNKEIQLGHKSHNEQINKNSNQHECTKKCLGEENLRKSKDSTENISIESISSLADEDGLQISRKGKCNEENHQQDNRRSRVSSPASSGKKKSERVKKKNEKTVPLKRLQT